MCTYQTARCAVEGSGKGAAGWFPLSTATVYVDHPVHAAAEHTLNIDFAAPERGASARVAVELTAESAIRMIATVAEALVGVPLDISGLSEVQVTRLRDLMPATAEPVEGGLPASPEMSRI